MIAHPIRKRLTRLLIGPAAFAGGWIGYGYGQAHHWAGMQALAAAGGAALVSASLVPVGIYLVTEVLYTLKALALAIWWIAVKLFWLALIVGGIGWQFPWFRAGSSECVCSVSTVFIEEETYDRIEDQIVTKQK